MTIIEDLQLLARNMEGRGSHSDAVLVRIIADRLSDATVLVAVPVGEVCRIDTLKPDSVFVCRGKAGVITSEYDGCDSVWPMGLDGRGVGQIFCASTVQPVRLLPITEANL